MDCLDDIIGFSQTTCECFDNPEDQESKSGIWLDELEGMELNLIEAADDCAKGEIWDRMAKAVTNATNEFRSDFLACVQTNYKQRYPNWAGLLGAEKYTTFLNLTTAYAGMRIKTFQSKGSFMNIKRIGVLVNASVPVTVHIYSSKNNGTLIQSYVINAVANTLTFGAVTPNLRLPLWDINSSTFSYYAILELDGSFKPLNNKSDCGCGGGNKRPWNKWIDIDGTKGNVPSGSISSFTTTSEVNGLILDIETKCENANVICSDDQPLDFDNDGYALKIGYAIRFKAGELLYHDLLSSSNINRYTLLDGERVAKYMEFYRTEYNKWIDFLCANAQIENNCCLICKSNIGLIKSNIRI